MLWSCYFVLMNPAVRAISAIPISRYFSKSRPFFQQVQLICNICKLLAKLDVGWTIEYAK